jgi:hypothetical protein
MHKHLVTSLGLQAACPPDCMPANHAMAGMAGGLAAAWTAAGRTDGVVLFVVQPGERNVFDQQWLQVRAAAWTNTCWTNTCIQADSLPRQSSCATDDAERRPRHQDCAPHPGRD